MVHPIQPPDLCGLCLDPMAGREVVPHKGVTPPSHAIHRECFLDWKERLPNQRAVCLMRCGGDIEYVDRPILFDQLLANAQRVYQCAICQLNLARPNPLLGPVLVHSGAEDRSHSVHKQCLKNWYAQRGNLNCPKNCGHSFSPNSLLTYEEQRYLERKEKRIAVAATIVLSSVTAASWCFLAKLISQVSVFIFRTHLTPFLKSVAQSTPGIFLGVMTVGNFCGLYVVVILGAGLALAKLAEKVGRCFRRFPDEGCYVILESMGWGMVVTLRIMLGSSESLSSKTFSICFVATTALAGGILAREE